MLKPALIYSPHYYADIGAHVFPMEKFRLTYQRLKDILDRFELINPKEASDEDLLTVHSWEYLQSLKNLKWNAHTMFSELPLTHEIISAFRLAAGGTIKACAEAIKRGKAINLTGGFHHAFPEKAEGFCYINDIAVGIKRLQMDKLITRAMVIDCDLHQGNGTAKIFQNDDSVFTFSIHQENNYPPKEKSDLDIGLPDFTNDEKYLTLLKDTIPSLLADFKPQLVVYQAGADPYQHDQLGQLSLSIEGLKQRDILIITNCEKYKIPIATVLGGGYAFNIEDTITIHYNTCLVLSE